MVSGAFIPNLKLYNIIDTLIFRKGQCFQNPWNRLLFVKPDKGFLLIENLTFPGRDLGVGGKLHMVDKTKIINVEVGKAAMRSLAHFHGIWLTWLTKKEPCIIGGMTKQDFIDVFAIKWRMKDIKGVLRIQK